MKRMLYYKRGYKTDIHVLFPKHENFSCTADEFIRQLRHSIALNTQEKLRVIDSLPTLSPFQLDELYRVFCDEHDEFKVLYKTEHEAICDMLAKRDEQWEEIKTILSSRGKYQDGILIEYDKNGNVTPTTLKQMIDANVIGQEHVTRELASAIYYQKLAISHVVNRKKLKLQPLKPIMLIGSTGSGKTFLVQKACEIAEIPFMHVDSSSMVQEGIVGFSTNDIAKQLLEKTENNVKLAEHSVVFFDEIDKLLHTSHGASVQSQLLRLLEGTELRISADRWDSGDSRPPVRALRTHNMLFILGGAFQNMIEKRKKNIGFASEADSDDDSLRYRNQLDVELNNQGFSKEFLGRIATILTLRPLGAKDYFAILKQSKSSPLKGFIERIEYHGDSVQINDEALMKIAQQAAKSQVGARALYKMLYKVFAEATFDAPSPAIKTYFITKSKVDEVLGE